MKDTKLLSGIFAVLGVLLMAGTAALCLTSLEAQPVLLGSAEDARERAGAMMDAVREGDYESAAGYMYGQPDLGVDREPADKVGVIIWDAFADSFSYRLEGTPSATDSGLTWTMYVDSLDMPAVMASLREEFRTQLEQRVEEAEDMTDIYDEDYNFREALVTEVLLQAAEQAAANGQTVSTEVALNLIYQDGQWWVSPDQALLEAISGGMAG